MQHNNIFFLFAMEAASADEVSSISKILELMYTAGKHAAEPSRGLKVFWAQKSMKCWRVD
jgi:hypothetical protein